MSRRQGSIYTPKEFADFLVTWAIEDPSELVMDLGIGEGSFVFTSYQRLIELGAEQSQAQNQLYGAEIDPSVFAKFIKLANERCVAFPNIYNDDFFNLDFPQIDVIVGNPPYVRRMNIDSIDDIRQEFLKEDVDIKSTELSRLSDLYIYFLLRAIAHLKPGGKLAVITADSWLNVGYGQLFKNYLLSKFEIESLISLDRKVFGDALVKPVMILARKKDGILPVKPIQFVRVKNGLPINKVKEALTNELPHTKNKNVQIHNILPDKLKEYEPWSVHFKVPEVFDVLSKNPLLTSISNIAQTRIGLQTLAKDFFVLTSEQVKGAKIERKFLRPLAQSFRYLNDPVIARDAQASFYLFYCSANKADLEGTNVLKYILQGENKEVTVRGKPTKLIGYQNKERITRSSRKYWYDLRTSLERRGIAKILIPRLTYKKFSVIWNQAAFIPGELFIEFLPLPLLNMPVEVHLAILNSTLTEVMLRAHAQVYGGGTYNINPGEIKRVRILNAQILTGDQRQQLKSAYLRYLRDSNHDRSGIDCIVYEIMGFSKTFQKKVEQSLRDLIKIATSTKKEQLHS